MQGFSQNFPRKTQAESQSIIQVSGTFPCLKGYAVYMKNTSEKHNANIMTLYLTSTYCKKINPTPNKPVRSRMWVCPRSCPGTKAQPLCLHILHGIRSNWPASTGRVLHQDMFVGTWGIIWQQMSGNGDEWMLMCHQPMFWRCYNMQQGVEKSRVALHPPLQ